jgi:hypothetical protein
VYGLSDAFPGLDKKIKSNILDQCLKTIALGEYEFTKELGGVVDNFITPLELRDSRAKVKLLEDPYVNTHIHYTPMLKFKIKLMIHTHTL